MTTQAFDYERRMREIVDKEAIWDTLKRLARGMDRHDAEMIAAAYHPDAFDDHGNYRGAPEGFIAHVNGTATDPGAHAKIFTDHYHVITNHVCDLAGDVAHAETYVTMFGQNRDSGRLSVVLARYVDRLEKRDGAWKILVRRVVLGPSGEFESPNALAASRFNLFVNGTWDRSDISYMRPLVVE